VTLIVDEAAAKLIPDDVRSTVEHFAAPWIYKRLFHKPSSF